MKVEGGRQLGGRSGRLLHSHSAERVPKKQTLKVFSKGYVRL